MMLEVNTCPECGVPKPFSEGHVWLNNGEIVQSANHRARLGFIECENLDPVFQNICEIIGAEIGPMIVNITARGAARYLNTLIPAEVRELVERGAIDVEPFTELITTFCQVIGYGKYEFLDYRYENDEGDYSKMRIYRPFSVPEAAGSFAGALAAVVGGEHKITYEEISPRLFEFTSRWTEFPEILKEKLPVVEHRHRDGDIELRRCPTCGVPLAFSSYSWHLGEGLIVNTHTGRRMALLGYELLDALFSALEAELGETIPNVVVEAQRRFVKTGFYSISEVSSEGDFRTQLALRGLGNLREISMGADKMYMRIENAACHFLLIGMAQGLFELSLDAESHIEWQLSDQGDLELTVTPRLCLVH